MKMAEKNSSGIMVFHPTMEEFKNFSKYIEYMEDQGAHEFGIAKVVPPDGWKARRGSYDDINIKIDCPIQQSVAGRDGCYQVFNMITKKTDFSGYRKLAHNFKYGQPANVRQLVFGQQFEEVERHFWSNLAYNPPIYGADVPGTLYDPDVKYWNVGHLGTILDVLKFGMWKASFAWHTEDMELYSINYLHYGDPKLWYAVPPKQGQKLEEFAANSFPQNYRDCSAFLRHKTTVISPKTLRGHGITVNKVVQNVNEFIVTFPGGYHSGFNCGFNIAESTNFASVRWIEHGKKAKRCMCSADAVRINMDVFVKRYQPELFEEWIAEKKAEALEVGHWPHKTLSSPSKRKRSAQNVKPMPSRSSSEDDLPFASELPASCSSGATLNARINHQKSIAVANNGSSGDGVNRNFDISDAFCLGDWAKPLEKMWQFCMYDLSQERAHNSERALVEPHCTVCQYFVPKALTNIAKVGSGRPQSSRRVLSEMFLNRDCMANKTGVEMESLLECEECAVTVHPTCVGLPRGGEIKLPWLCQRCTRRDLFAECQLCCLRGGLLQQTRDGDWVHLVCALMLPAIYVELGPAGREIVIERLKARRDTAQQCNYCHNRSGLTQLCSYDDCKVAFHITCAHEAGCCFELYDWPVLASTVCLRHNGPGRACQVDSLKNLDDGVRVLAVRDSESGERDLGTVMGFSMETCCVVDFDDGTFSNDVDPADIKACECRGKCFGAHLSGTRVKVMWTDGLLYNGHFRRAYKARTYVVRFDDGFVKASCPRGDITPLDDLPESLIDSLNSDDPAYGSGDENATLASESLPKVVAAPKKPKKEHAA